ncbi:fructose-bisphosphate aldolase class II [Motilibacter peucedani]|uniref:Fructose-bisphosphate aldolase class II n=1 Tax=Motilibacter peucedani TaxID=598650 RepID=A0A420XQB9_9ACTN|nr:ketose-bisphosphate aldolase [Motilibacter peucedani]RKS75488.1 fructose-bisphosphate aldolase class II [Motilibacter peucedani]
MPLVTTAEVVAGARDRGAAAAAFNVITLEHVEAVVLGARTAGSPVVVQVSENAVRYHGGAVLPLAAACRAAAEAAEVPVALHLDHVEDVHLLHRTAEAGFSSVMFDASKLAYDDNVAATRSAAQWAHGHGLWLEAELGEIGGKDGAHAPGVRTKPEEAQSYVAATGVDALAVAVGSSHAMTSRTASLDDGLIARLRDALDVPLVLHGSSGVADDDLRSAVAHGIAKVNIGTILNVAFTGAVREVLAADERLTDPRTYLVEARRRTADVVAHLLGVVSGER